MQKICYILAMIGGLYWCMTSPSFAQTTELKAFAIKEEKQASFLIVNSTKQPSFKLFTLENPHRVVLDISSAQSKAPLPRITQGGFIKAIRTAQKENSTFRVVLDTMDKPFEVQASTLLPDGQGIYQLQLSITHAPASFEEMVEIALNDNTPIPTPNPENRAQKNGVPSPTPRPVEIYKPIIIVDAGHGGHDPGSIGRRGTKEKDITIAYAKELFDQLRNTGKYRPILTRSVDKYIPLRGRVNIARKYKADLFVSLHADSHNNPHVKGMSVYTLSDTASDKEAAALARKENKSDIITGINLQHEDREITNVLISIAQRDTMNQSALFAEHIVRAAGDQITLLRNPHRFAGFRVLTAADVPSVLVELGYLSNHREEKLLTTEKHKKEVVGILVKAIHTHFGN